MTALAIAEAVRSGKHSAEAVTQDTLARIDRFDGGLNSCTRVLGDRAIAHAQSIDARIARGEDPGPLAGVPFGAKDLFDIAGLPNTGGAASRLDAAPAEQDAEAIRRLEAAGAVLVASCNMDEFAYGFATVNAHYGATHNPHDPDRLAGGSSGGSAASVAGGLFPLALGSDTNGSIRVPASLCGIYGLKPTHDDLPMEGVLPFVDSFDDIGPFAATLEDLHLVWSVLRGGAEPVGSGEDLRVARLGGFFEGNLHPELAAGIEQVCAELAPVERVELPDVARARSAAYLMTAVEGGALHLPELRRDAMAFDPATRDRLIAGAMTPSAIYFEARRFRAWFLDRVLELFEQVDVLIGPAAPTVAPLIADPVVTVDGKRVAARAHLGIYTQPLSFVGLASLAVPLKRPCGLPLGLQLVAAPGQDAKCFALAARLERAGLVGATPPSLLGDVLTPEVSKL